MRRFKKFLIIIVVIPLLNIFLITICNGLIEGSWWKYSRGADYKDFIEFDEKMQAKSILIRKDGETEKIILVYLFDYMIICDTDLTNWTYYARKGKRKDPNNTATPQQMPTKITGTPSDKKLLDSLIKDRE